MVEVEVEVERERERERRETWDKGFEEERRRRLNKKKIPPRKFLLPWLPTTAAYRALSRAGLHCSKNASQIDPWPLA